MGLQDRDYSRYQDDDDRWWRGEDHRRSSSLGPFSGAAGITKLLIAINVAVFFADMLLSDNKRQSADPAVSVGADGVATLQRPAPSAMADWFEVRPDTLVKPWQWYRFLTYGFVHDNSGIQHILFNMLGLFIFGSAIEPRMGRKEYLRFYLAAIVIGGIVTALRWVFVAAFNGVDLSEIGAGTIGASGAIMAVTILFAFFFPDATILVMFLFPMKAWVVAVIYVAMNVLGMIGSNAPVAYDVHLAGAAWAALYHMRGWRLAGFSFSGLDKVQEFFRRRGPRLKLHDPEKKLAQQEAEVDRLLDKIQAFGIDSLTNSERKTLERHSRLKRSQRGGT